MPACHHADAVARFHGAAHDPDRADRAAVVVVVAVKDQRAHRRVRVALGRRNTVHHGREHLFDADALLGGDQGTVFRVQADLILDFMAHDLGPRAGQIDLVDDRHDLQIMLQRHVDVGQRLRLDALAGVHHQYRALACGKRPGDLIGEVHVAGGIDEVEHVGDAVRRRIRQAHGLGFDGNAALPLQFHRIEHLLGHVAQGHYAGLFQKTVSQRRLAVVDVRDDAEVSDVLLVDFGHVFASPAPDFSRFLPHNTLKRAKNQPPQILPDLTSIHQN